MATQLKFKTVLKDKLFYDNYRYCVSFHLDEITALKILDHEHIDIIIARRKTWREMSRHRLNGRNTASSIPIITPMRMPGTPSITHIPQTIISKRWKDITEQTEENLHKLADILIKTSVDFKLVTSVNQGWVYTNSKTLVKQLDKMAELEFKEFKEVHINRPKNTVKLKNPKHTHRSYFKLTKISDAEKERLVNFFVNQQDHIRLSPALAQWTVTPFKRTQDYFFVDYTGEEWLIMIALINPSIIRKTSAIIPA